jgi:hypothetical protein
MKGKTKLLLTQIIRLNNVNFNGDNVVANYLNHTNLFIFLKNVKIEFKKNHHMLFFSKGCHNYPQNKTPHIVHHAYEY